MLEHIWDLLPLPALRGIILFEWKDLYRLADKQFEMRLQLIVWRLVVIQNVDSRVLGDSDCESANA